MKKIKIKSIGFDSLDREVFQTEKGSLLCDVNLDRTHQNMRLCAKLNNDFDGEPDFPLNTEKFEIVEDFSSTCKTCAHSYQCVNGTYCRFHHQLVEYKRTTCQDYAPV